MRIRVSRPNARAYFLTQYPSASPLCVDCVYVCVCVWEFRTKPHNRTEQPTFGKNTHSKLHSDRRRRERCECKCNANTTRCWPRNKRRPNRPTTTTMTTTTRARKVAGPAPPIQNRQHSHNVRFTSEDDGTTAGKLVISNARVCVVVSSFRFGEKKNNRNSTLCRTIEHRAISLCIIFDTYLRYYADRKTLRSALPAILLSIIVRQCREK